MTEDLLLDVKSLKYHPPGASSPIMDDVSLSVANNEAISIVGRSGCGKSTLLKLIGGFYQPTSGVIVHGSRIVAEPSPNRAMVFQSFSQLLPWKSAKQNLVFALHHSGVRKDRDNGQLADQYLEMVGLAGYEDYFPHQLSGGMQQRVALARTLCLDPSLVLLDEPFSALDEFTRSEMQRLVLDLRSGLQLGMIFVTHSIDEAILLGHRVLVLANGRLVYTTNTSDIDNSKVRSQISNLLGFQE